MITTEELKNLKMNFYKLRIDKPYIKCFNMHGVEFFIDMLIKKSEKNDGN